MIKNIRLFAGATLLMVAFSSCYKNEFGVVDLTMPEDNPGTVAGEYVYNHPCAMYNEADFTRVKKMLDDGTAPAMVKTELANLKNVHFTYIHSFSSGRNRAWRCYRNRFWKRKL